ncbi:MAG: hypothetical protein A2W90_11530 [Bacteroidetes bacterium GWF2_42_66]|nr:MAG: hypothetical protein A2W92_13535 [Bacteroidetes bacterium GWA2_42_15]OFY01794.1 MAG: hypothetical protein A2W89_23040 [Bacteroidetes bacterium GWE2_42_39]OFY44912.1 MAG: hypothetical protein A2W90_11530 [Bacteroidetes bacterium GWF2_42_66]HBL76040.1 hypothetical protein [Prolixibacteraceae bacterium]HCR89665.1 hypothetical protein [Prolixibacteraceae bacterium]
MNKHLHTLFIFIAVFFLTSSVFAQIPDDLILSLKSGNDKALAEYFNQNIELVVPGHDDVFSKSQAQQLIAKFFKEYPPENFSLIHQRDSGNEGAGYAIGSLETSKGNFRVVFLMKTSNGKAMIHQLRIEKQA